MCGCRAEGRRTVRPAALVFRAHHRLRPHRRRLKDLQALRENAGAPFLAVASTAPKYWVGVRMPFISIPGQEQSLRSVLMFISPGFFTNPFFFDLRPWLAMGGAALLITAICWLPLMRNVTHSI